MDEYNRISYVHDGYTEGLPSDCAFGIREVYFYNSNSVFFKITGLSKDNQIKVWFNYYNGEYWIGYKSV